MPPLSLPLSPPLPAAVSLLFSFLSSINPPHSLLLLLLSLLPSPPLPSASPPPPDLGRVCRLRHFCQSVCEDQRKVLQCRLRRRKRRRGRGRRLCNAAPPPEPGPRRKVPYQDAPFIKRRLLSLLTSPSVQGSGITSKGRERGRSVVLNCNVTLKAFTLFYSCTYIAPNTHSHPRPVHACPVQCLRRSNYLVYHEEFITLTRGGVCSHFSQQNPTPPVP